VIAVALLVLPLVLATPLKNAALHGNPYYPIRVSIAGHVLPGPERPYDGAPEWLASAPRPWRFVCSLLETRVRPMTSTRRWTVDQWMPEETGGNRMGGFFHAYVLLHLAALGIRVARDRARPVRVAAIGFLALTVLVAFMPQSHELRYYMCWMIALVALNLMLACREGAAAIFPGPTALGVASALALGVVLGVTRGGYAYPSGASFAELVRDRTDAASIAAIHDGEHVCVASAPWNVLWAAPFHEPRRYVVKEAERTADCGADRPID
jgi:hypothetical protein